MKRVLLILQAVCLLAGAVLALSSCTKMQSEGATDEAYSIAGPEIVGEEVWDVLPPETMFVSTPGDTVFTSSPVAFQWIGTDPDGDVVGYQRKLLETDAVYFFTAGAAGEILRSVDPASTSGEAGWTRAIDSFVLYSSLSDGFYEFRVRSVDDSRAVDWTPAIHRFSVFVDDSAPTPEIVSQCGTISPQTSYVFEITATDSSRSASTPRHLLEYSVRLRPTSSACPEHANDPFTLWTPFPDDTQTPVLIGNAPPTLYDDLFSAPCQWQFTLQVRDPAGNISAAYCTIRTL